jgi:hypothetical protein
MSISFAKPKMGAICKDFSIAKLSWLETSPRLLKGN